MRTMEQALRPYRVEGRQAEGQEAPTVACQAIEYGQEIHGCMSPASVLTLRGTALCWRHSAMLREILS